MTNRGEILVIRPKGDGIPNWEAYCGDEAVASRHPELHQVQGESPGQEGGV